MERHFTPVFWVCESSLYGVMAPYLCLICVCVCVRKHEVTVRWTYITRGRKLLRSAHFLLDRETDLLTFTGINSHHVNTLLAYGKKKRYTAFRFHQEDAASHGNWSNIQHVLQSLIMPALYLVLPLRSFVNTEELISPQASRTLWLTVWNWHVPPSKPPSVSPPLQELAAN